MCTSSRQHRLQIFLNEINQPIRYKAMLRREHCIRIIVIPVQYRNQVMLVVIRALHRIRVT